MEILAKWVVISFGVFFIAVGFLMLLKPAKAREILRKAGSTPLINYGEITLRLIPAAALILAADLSRYPEVFEIVGWFMAVTSLLLYFVPRRWHHQYSLKAAALLKPLYFQLIAPFSFFIGGWIIYSII